LILQGEGRQRQTGGENVDIGHKNGPGGAPKPCSTLREFNLSAPWLGLHFYRDDLRIDYSCRGRVGIIKGAPLIHFPEPTPSLGELKLE
jgi:hypothetical protein